MKSKQAPFSGPLGLGLGFSDGLVFRVPFTGSAELYNMLLFGCGRGCNIL